MNYRAILLLSALLLITCSVSAEFMTNYTFDSVTSSNNQGAAYIAIKADDRNLGTTAQGYEGAGQHYSWTGDFGVARYIEGYNITMAAGFLTFGPDYFTISGSNDNVNYYVIDYVTGVPAWVDSVNKTFGMYNFTANQTSYRYIRFDSIRCKDASNPAITEIQFYNKGNVPITSAFTMVNTTPMADHVNTNFIDQSFATPAVSTWNWSYQGIDAGNNTKTIFSTLQNPTNIRFNAGNWSIKLNVTNSLGFSETTTPAWINVTQPQLYQIFSNFTAVPTNPTVFETAVTFIPENNWSANRFQWDFGDGSTFLSYNGSVTHVYSTPGLKTVSLTSYLYQNTSITNSTTRTDYINPAYSLTYVVADFTGSPTSGSPGLLVTFTDATIWGNSTTTGRIYEWDFGDPYSSTPNSSASVGVQHVYATSGTYTVILRVNNTADPALGSDVETKMNYIVVSNNQNQLQYVVQQTRFTVVDKNGNPLDGAHVELTPNNSTLPSSYNWLMDLFGFNSASSSEILATTLNGTTVDDGTIVFVVHPTIQYTLTVTDPVSSRFSTFTKTIYPSETSYTIMIPTYATTMPTDPGAMINATLYTVAASDPTIYLNLSYNDTSLSTTNITFFIQHPNYTFVYKVTIPATPALNQSTDVGYSVQNVRGASYVWGYYANSTFGNRSKSTGITFNGPNGGLLDLFGDHSGWE